MALIAISLVIAAYFDSRVSYLVITAFLIVSPTALGFRWTAIFLILILGVLGGIYVFGDWARFSGQIQVLFQVLSGTVAVLWSSPMRDVTRYGLLIASFAAVNANLGTWLFGYGIYSERFVIGPYLARVYGAVPGVNRSVGDYVRTETFEALFVGTGYIGMLLMAANFLFVALSLLAQKSPMRFVLLMALVLTFAWLFVAEIQDVVLLYLIIMPMGPLVQLGQRRTAPQALIKLSAN